MEYNTANKIKMLGKPLIVLSMVILLIIIVLVFGLDKIQVLNQRIKNNKKTEEQLIQKIETLKNVRVGVDESIAFIDMALPSRGITLFGLNQIKNKAKQFNLSLENLKITVPVALPDGIEKTSISFDLNGDAENQYLFFDSFRKTLPLTDFGKLSFNNVGENLTTNVILNIYGSEQLDKIPAISEQINNLTSEETKTLSDLSEFDLPEFGILVPNEISTRDDMFN